MSAPCLVRVKISARSTVSFRSRSTRTAGFAAAIDPDHALLDALGRRGVRGHRDLERVAQQLRREVGDGARHGRGEHQRLPLARQLGDDFADVGDEAHVEHAVGFVEHQEFDVAEAQRVGPHEIEQPARRSDEDIDAVEQRADLGAHRHAADRQSRGQAEVAAIGAEAVEDLSRQFARRAQHQHAAAFCAPRRLGVAASRCRIGSAKAAVLPVPVWAMPITSRPRHDDRNGLCSGSGSG